MAKAEYVGSKLVLKELGIKAQTLYAYVSRGWIKSIPDPDSRGRLYLKSDIEKIRLRKRARSGHAVTAASALHFGDPILESSITEILENTIRYRGRDLFTDLCDRNVPFENVAELLWTGSLVAEKVTWSKGPTFGTREIWDHAFEQAKGEREPRLRMASLISRLTLSEVREADSRADQTRVLARELYRHLSGLVLRDCGNEPESCSIVEQVCLGYGLYGDDARRVINVILLACADHELNTATFVARTAAANGTDTLLCLESAYAAFRGAQQAFQSDLVEAWNAKLSPKMSDRQLNEILSAEVLHDGKLQGFGHALYPEGDPRARYLIDLGRTFNSDKTRTLDRAIHWAREHYQTEPNLDVGLVYLTRTLGLPQGAASTLFSLSRFSGMIAHIIEQREAGTPIRPRAKFV